MLEVNYSSGEAMRIGDRVKLLSPLLDRERLAVVKTLIFPFEEQWRYLGFKNPGVWFASELGEPILAVEFQPVPEKNQQWFTSADFSASFREKWECVHFMERSEGICYYSGETVKLQDVVAVECGYDASIGTDRIEIGHISRIISPLEKHLMRVPLNTWGTGLTDYGVLIVRQDSPETVCWVEQVIDHEQGYYTDCWQHVHFIRRG